MTRDEFIKRVAANADRIAEDALAVGRSQVTDAASAVGLIRDVAHALGQNSLLSKRTQARRLEMLFGHLALRRDQFRLLAGDARQFAPHLRVTVAGAIPASAQRGVYGSSPSPVPTAGTTTAASPPLVAPDRRPHVTPDAAEARPTYSTVLLLSHPDHQHANRALLDSADLEPLVVETPTELEKALAMSMHICGCALDQSALVPPRCDYPRIALTDSSRVFQFCCNPCA